VTDTRASAADLGFIPAAEALADEERLAGLARAHDHATWASLFDRYYPVLCRYAYARLGSSAEAEDVASQTFLKAYEAIGRYEYRKRPMLAWLYTICRNLANKRRGSSSWARTVALAEADETAGQTTEADFANRLDLMEAVLKLKDQQRDVVILRFSLGMSLRETAAVLNTTEAAVHSLQTRALANLRLRLKWGRAVKQ
jgi:RNA polymerase sigma-70 factor, ECF subfamily